MKKFIFKIKSWLRKKKYKKLYNYWDAHASVGSEKLTEIVAELYMKDKSAIEWPIERLAKYLKKEHKVELF